jgi:hypothetical protein
MLTSCKTNISTSCCSLSSANNMLHVFRDELCRGGDLLHSPALSYTLLHLAAAVEATRQQKLLQEQPEEEAETRSSEDSLRISSEVRYSQFLDSCKM